MPQWEYLKLVATVTYAKTLDAVSSRGYQTIRFELQPVRTQYATPKQISEQRYAFNSQDDDIDPVELVTSHMDEHICKLGLAGWELITFLRHGNGSINELMDVYTMPFLFKRSIRKKPENQ